MRMRRVSEDYLFDPPVIYVVLEDPDTLEWRVFKLIKFVMKVPWSEIIEKRDEAFRSGRRFFSITVPATMWMRKIKTDEEIAVETNLFFEFDADYPEAGDKLIEYDVEDIIYEGRKYWVLLDPR